MGGGILAISDKTKVKHQIVFATYGPHMTDDALPTCGQSVTYCLAHMWHFSRGVLVRKKE